MTDRPMDAVDVLNGVIAAKDAEIERLKDALTNTYRLLRERHAELIELRARLRLRDGTGLIEVKLPEASDD